MTDAPNNPFPPGVAEAMREAGADVSDILPQKEPPATKAVPRHSVRYLVGTSAKRRFADVELECPIEFDGKPFHKIVVRRLTVAEVGDYIDALLELRKTDETTVLPFPLFVDEDGNDLPDGLIDALVDDDLTRLNKVAEDFLPLRFRMGEQEAEKIEQPKPSPGDTSGSSSDTLRDGA